MAKRYSSTHSPGAKPSSTSEAPISAAPAQHRKASGEWKLGLLFTIALLFPLRAFFGDATWLIQSLGALALVVLALILTREGMRAHAAFDQQKIARKPVLPRKIIGSVIFGLGLALGSYASGAGVVPAMGLGLVSLVLHLGAFGLDPMQDKGIVGMDPFQSDRVAQAIAEAEATLSQIEEAALRLRDRAMETRVFEFTAAARTLFRTVESSPGDLGSVRRYLSVYLTGARDATAKFADHYALTQDEKSRTDYLALLSDLQTTFADRSKSLMTSPNTDLDVEISVLRDRLKMEN